MRCYVKFDNPEYEVDIALVKLLSLIGIEVTDDQINEAVKKALVTQ